MFEHKIYLIKTTTYLSNDNQFNAQKMFKEPNHFLILFEFLKSTRKLLGTICVIKYYVIIISYVT